MTGGDRSRQGGTRVSIFGAPLDSGNLGVSALSLSTVHGLLRRRPDLKITLFDNGRDRRTQQIEVGDLAGQLEQRGAWLSRRIHRAESLWSMHASSHVRPAINANVRAVDASLAVLDISGGDSFTDLYGPRRFNLVTLPKLVTLRRGRPLFLLPQTYGPFHEGKSKQLASSIIRRSERAWARDDESFHRLRELVGDDFDPSRHRQARDVAFSLPPRQPRSESVVPEGRPPVGINVSGLLWHQHANGRTKFGLRAQYADAMTALVRRFVEETDEHVLLVPHVVGSRESDDSAAHQLVERIGPSERLSVLRPDLGADEIKSVIGRCTWFTGARMHATIAALSSCTPATAIAYSDKFSGVFDGCGVRNRVLDARKLSTVDLTDSAFEAYVDRHADAKILAERIPDVRSTVEDQFDDLVESMGLTVPTSEADR